MDNSEVISHLELCTGYAGISRGLEKVLTGVICIASCEREAFAISNLVAKAEKGFLDSAPHWTDLRSFPFRKFRGLVDILSGGFPCQPFAKPGQHYGDKDSRHLFPHILNGIIDCQPELVFLENVEGIISSKIKGGNWEDPVGTPVLFHVLRQLERHGYESTCGIFSSAEVGASQWRKRIFILAHSINARLERYSFSIRQKAIATGSFSTRIARASRPWTDQWPGEPPRLIKSGMWKRFIDDWVGVESEMERKFDGNTNRLDYAKLSRASDSRVDELRLIGNGVDPEVAARAFVTLLNQLNQ